jgi:DNA-binding NtrC family response regulator
MNTPNILVVGRHAQIMETVLRLLHSQSGWKAKGALTDLEAHRLFEQEDFNLVLIGGGVEAMEEEALKSYFLAQRPTLKVIRHYGGGSGLLFNEVLEALHN